MALMPETIVFRSFRALNARNLLYYQAELTLLEKRLLEIEKHDSQDEKRKRYAVDWEWMSCPENEEDATQNDLVMNIRTLLEKYSESWHMIDSIKKPHIKIDRALIDQSIINGFNRPDKWDLKYLQHFLSSQTMGPLALIGEDADTWGSVQNPDSYRSDVVTLRPRQHEDPFSKMISESFIGALFRCGCARFKKPSSTNGLVGCHDSSVQRVTSWVSNSVASLIPVLSIVILTHVTSTQGKLGVIAGFNFLIAACLSALTNAKRTEVFAVTAA